MSSPAPPAPSTPPAYWQIGVLVQDLEGAMEEMSRSLHLTWTDIKVYGTTEQPMRVVMSQEGPPYFELVEGPPGSAWDCSDGPKLDHLAYWTPDIAQERARLEEAGAPVVMDGEARGKLVNYHALPTAGFRIEVFDASRRDEIRSDWDFEDVG